MGYCLIASEAIETRGQLSAALPSLDFEAQLSGAQTRQEAFDLASQSMTIVGQHLHHTSNPRSVQLRTT